MKALRSSKKLPIVALSLATVAVGTIGFASWVIMSVTPTEKQSINLTVADIVDKSVTLAVAKDPAPDLSVRFDADKTDNKGSIRFEGAENEGEDLTFGFTFTATAASGNVKDILKSINLTYTASAEITEAVTNKLIVMPFDGASVSVTGIFATGTYYDGTAQTSEPASWKQKYVVTETSNTVLTIAATYHLHWGEAFGGTNPSLYEEQEGSDVAAIKANLEALSKLNGKAIADLQLTPVV